MLGVQLYDLISKTDTNREQITNFYAFMSALGMAAQAIDIVYQLNAAEDVDPAVFQRGASPLESLCFGRNGTCGCRPAGSGAGRAAAGRSATTM